MHLHQYPVLDRVAALGIGLAFLIASISILWLWLHRRNDWPKSWVLAMVSACMLTCAISRLLHAGLDHDTDNSAIVIWADFVTAGTGLIGAMLLPWGIMALRRLPTPTDYENTLRDAQQKKLTEARLRWEQSHSQRLLDEASKKQRQLDALHTILQGVGSLDDSLKARIEAVIREA